MQITGATASNTITFQSETGVASSVTLQFAATAAASNYVIRLGGASYVQFKNLTLVSSGVGTSYRNVVLIDGTVHAVSGLLLQGNTLTGYFGSSSSSDLALVCDVNTSQESDLTILNNMFIGGSYGIVLSGSSSARASGTLIKGNTINNSGGEGGMSLGYQKAVVIDSNSVTAVDVGIAINSCGNPSGIPQLLVQRNRVVMSGGAGSYGMSLTSYEGNASSSGLVANNFVSMVGTGGNGLRVSGSLYLNVYYNSVNMTGSNASSIAFFQNGGTDQNVENNIFVNSGGGYAVYINTPSTIAVSDYNDFFTTGAVLAYWGGADRANLAALQAAGGKDAHSSSTSVAFVSPSDLHLTGASIGDRFLLGTPITGITTDIDGNVRSATKPYMGANEGSVPLAVDDKGVEPRNGVEQAPLEYQLHQNYPNPFNPSSTIRYSLPQESNVSLAVFSTLGQQVATLVRGEQEAGYHEVKFDATGLSSGVYFCRLEAGDFVQTRKLLLLR
jgi:hypothetical protein